jgi:hypothetical protein
MAPRIGHGVQFGAIALLLLGLAACGYHMEGEYLPENLTTLSIGPIHNRTYTGELDVRLKHELRRKLSRNPNLRLAAQGRGELTLEIELTSAKITRRLDVSDTDLSSLRMRLRGNMTLHRTDVQPRIIRQRQINIVASLRFDTPVIETPAVRDEITNDAIVLFVENVESVIYSNF